MLREYEVTIITRGEMPDTDRLKTLEKYEQILLQDGGQLINKADWGVKKMSHPIKRNYKGHYMNYDLTTLPNHVTEAERLMRIDDNVLRYLSINIGQDVDIKERKAEIAKQAAYREKEMRKLDDRN